MSLKQRDGVEWNFLRIGHTHYTHAHFMKKEPPRTCQICDYPTSIKDQTQYYHRM